jgi:hypothetical protein
VKWNYIFQAVAAKQCHLFDMGAELAHFNCKDGKNAADIRTVIIDLELWWCSYSKGLDPIVICRDLVVPE